ncbi:MAG: hypothetical protein J0L63_13990 [Anaerolineae bacterium]|nr:hypothetical protein [Anaerolineae bacterium]
MSNMGINRWQMIQAGLLLLAVTASAVMLVSFFDRIPIEGTSLALDWKGLWQAMRGGIITYQNELGFRIPPWTALLVAPLGFLSMQASWGLMAFITIMVLLISVPRVRSKGLYLVSIFLLILSYPSLRHTADGNFEAIIISGALLTIYGYQKEKVLPFAIGILLIVSKPQESSFVIAALGIYALVSQKRRFWLYSALVVLAVSLPFLLVWGKDWITTMLAISERGSIMDMSLMAALNRTGFIPPPLVLVIWLLFTCANLYIVWVSRPRLSREKVGMLIGASLLIAPYAAGNSMVTVLAIGIIPLFQARRYSGLLLILLINTQFFLSRDFLFQWGAYYATTILLLSWGFLAWRVMSGQDEPLRKTLPAAASTR